jgi:hypothetical protein
MRGLWAACVLLFAWLSLGAASSAEVDAIARYFAGLTPTDEAALGDLTQSAEWIDHAKALDIRWNAFEHTQLVKVKRFARLHSFREPVAFYMFGGPDYAYIASFFPNAKVYVLSGLEPIADPPDPLRTPPAERGRELARLRNSLKSFFEYGFFVTKEMQTTEGFVGVLPILYALMARSGDHLISVGLVHLAQNGVLADGNDSGTPGVRLSFTDAANRPKTLYYFNVDLSDRDVGRSGFLMFCAHLAQGDSLLKDASYLLHRDDFSQTRDFLLARSRSIVQDDSGIPLRYLDRAAWRVILFGGYHPPSGSFERFYQADLAALARAQPPRPIDFAMGYFWWFHGSGLQIATNKGSRPGETPELH